MAISVTLLTVTAVLRLPCEALLPCLRQSVAQESLRNTSLRHHLDIDKFPLCLWNTSKFQALDRLRRHCQPVLLEVFI